MPCIGFGECCHFLLLSLFAVWKTLLPGNNSNVWIINLLWGLQELYNFRSSNIKYKLHNSQSQKSSCCEVASKPALPSPGVWNCPYSKGGRVEKGIKAFKDSIYLQLPEHSVKMKHQCQSLKIVCYWHVCQMSILYSQFLCILLLTVMNIIFTSVSDKNGKCCRKGDFIWYWDVTESDSQSNM